MTTRKKKRADGRLCKTFQFEGKRYFVYGTSAKELAEKEFQKREELKAGKDNFENPTLFSYYEHFTENRRGKVKEATIRAQCCQFRDCAEMPVGGNGRKLGDIRIRDIRPFDVQTVQRGLSDSGRHTTTVNNCVDHLSHVFNSAVKAGLIDRNPCVAVDPVRRTDPPARETKHRALTLEETERFFQHAVGSFFYNHFALMIKTGIRVGELGALTAADLSTKDGQTYLTINKTVTRNESGGYTVGSTKTNAGTRSIAVEEDVVRIIREQRRKNHRLFNGTLDGGTIFRSAEGALLREYPVNREIKKICKAAGIEHFTCHAFRATYATRFIEQRPDLYKTLSVRLGHSNTKITLDLYTHVMNESNIEAAKTVVVAI